MSNFSDFLNNQNNEQINKSTLYNDSNNSNSTEEKTKNLENLINKYSNYSNDDLMREFLKLTMDKKKKGELNREELENIKNTILPYLDEKQKQNLKQILDLVDNV